MSDFVKRSGPRAWLRRAITSAPTRALAKIVTSPEWLKISVMTRDALLFDIGQIERGKWADVVDVPQSTILPRHAWHKPRFEVFE